MSWLYGQTWLWYLIAFLVGLLLAWLVFVRPQQRRWKALLSASPAPADGPRSDGGAATSGAGAAPGAAVRSGTGPAAAAMAGAAATGGGAVVALTKPGGADPRPTRRPRRPAPDRPARTIPP